MPCTLVGWQHPATPDMALRRRVAPCGSAHCAMYRLDVSHSLPFLGGCNASRQRSYSPSWQCVEAGACVETAGCWKKFVFDRLRRRRTQRPPLLVQSKGISISPGPAGHFSSIHTSNLLASQSRLLLSYNATCTSCSLAYETPHITYLFRHLSHIPPIAAYISTSY